MKTAIECLKEIKSMGMKPYKLIGGGIIVMRPSGLLTANMKNFGITSEASDEYFLEWLQKNKDAEEESMILFNATKRQNAELN